MSWRVSLEKGHHVINLTGLWCIFLCWKIKYWNLVECCFEVYTDVMLLQSAIRGEGVRAQFLPLFFHETIFHNFTWLKYVVGIFVCMCSGPPHTILKKSWKWKLIITFLPILHCRQHRDMMWCSFPNKILTLAKYVSSRLKEHFPHIQTTKGNVMGTGNSTKNNLIFN